MGANQNEKISRTGCEKLPTAKDHGLTTRPCDICKGTEEPVSFWGGSSVLVCSKDYCNKVCADRWQRLYDGLDEF